MNFPSERRTHNLNEGLELPEYHVHAKDWTLREDDGRPVYVIERWHTYAGGRTMMRFQFREDAQRVADFLNENARFESL